MIKRLRAAAGAGAPHGPLSRRAGALARGSAVTEIYRTDVRSHASRRRSMRILRNRRERTLIGLPPPDTLQRIHDSNITSLGRVRFMISSSRLVFGLFMAYVFAAPACTTSTTESLGSHRSALVDENPGDPGGGGGDPGGGGGDPGGGGGDPGGGGGDPGGGGGDPGGGGDDPGGGGDDPGDGGDDPGDGGGEGGGGGGGDSPPACSTFCENNYNLDSLICDLGPPAPRPACESRAVEWFFACISGC
jgi:hypothetical protein